MELAALPWSGIVRGFLCLSESGMRIGRDHVGNADAARFQRQQNLSPVSLGFGECGRDTKYHAFAIIPANSGGMKNGTIPYGTVDPHLYVSGIQDQISDFRQRPAAPFFKGLIKLCSQP